MLSTVTLVRCDPISLAYSHTHLTLSSFHSLHRADPYFTHRYLHTPSVSLLISFHFLPTHPRFSLFFSSCLLFYPFFFFFFLKNRAPPKISPLPPPAPLPI